MNEENGMPQGIQVDILDQLLAAPLVLLDLPPTIYAEHILPMLADRESFNNLRSASKEIYNTSHQLITSGKLVPPWPKTSIELSSRVGPLAFSPNGGLLACGCLDGIIRLWNRHVGRRYIIIFEGHTRNIKSLAFSPDGSVLASASEDHTVRLWSIADPSSRVLQGVLQGHTDVVNSVAFSPNGSLLASGGDDGEIRLWNTSDGRCTRRIVRLVIMEEISSLSFSSDGETLVAGGHYIDNDYGAILLWDLSNDDHISATNLYAENDEGSDVYAISYSPDGRYLASASGNGLVRLWNTSDGSCKSVLEGHQAAVTSICFSPNGNILASVCEDGCLRLWNVQDASCLLVLPSEHPLGCIWSVTFSPDGQTLVTGGDDQRVCFWNPYEEKNRDKQADWENICRLWSIIVTTMVTPFALD